MSTMTTSEPGKTTAITKGENAKPIQNMGYLDRIIRFALGVALISIGATALIMSSASPTWLEESTTMPVWPYVIILIGIVPLFTAILGWCPVYKLFGIKSCGGKNNPCGTLPFELYAATGKDPKPKTQSDHSLGNSEKQNLNKLG